MWRLTFLIGVIVWTEADKEEKPETPDATAAREIPVASVPGVIGFTPLATSTGGADLLDMIAREIEADLGSAPVATAPGAVFLGDYVAAGPIRRACSGAWRSATSLFRSSRCAATANRCF